MRLPYWLLRLLPMWDYICPRCRRKVSKNSHECPHCGELYGVPLRVPPRCLKDKKALEDYVHEHIFPKVSAGQREYLARFFTEFFSDGFESGDFSAWSGTSVNGATIEVASDYAKQGAYSCKVSGLDGTAEGGWVYKDLGTAYSELYVRQYWRIDGEPEGSGFWHVGPYVAISGSSDKAKPVFNFATDKWGIHYRDSGGSWVVSYESGTSTVNIGTWYCVELHVKGDNPNSVLELWVDGVQKLSLTGLSLEYESWQYVFVGDRWVEQGQTVARTVWVDCVVVADAYIGLEGGQTYEVYVDAAVQGFASPVTQTTFNVEKNAAVMGQGLSGRETVFNVVDAAVVSVVSMPLFQSMFNVGSDAVLRVVAEVGVVKEGEVKVTRVFLVLGDLAIQLTGD